MRYLLDSDTLSELVKRTPRQAFLERFLTTPRDDKATSSITVGELLFGAHRRSGRVDVLASIERELLDLPVLPFDDAGARVYGPLRAHLERQGTPIGDADTRIAAIALSRDMVVVTGNVRHFERVPGLAIENWLA